MVDDRCTTLLPPPLDAYESGEHQTVPPAPVPTDIGDPPLEAARERLLDAVDKLGWGEVLVLASIADRLVMGRAQYGDLDPWEPRRTWLVEAAEEAADLTVYLACDLILRGTR